MMTTDVQIGLPLPRVTINLERRHERDFLDELDDGMWCYCECDIKQCLMTVEELVDVLQGIASNADSDTGDRFPRAWVPGFVLGWATGLNNPNIANDDPCLTYIESLVRKHTLLYRNLLIQVEEPATEEHPDTEPLPVTVTEPARVL